MTDQPALGFAGLLRQLRAGARLTQEELAEAAGLSPRSVSDLERGINRTARKDTAELLAGALGLAEPVSAVFVAAARGRAPAAEVLAALRGEATAPGGLASGRDPVWPGCPYLGLVPFEERDARMFYGRGELVDQLVQRLAGAAGPGGMLLVAGESGAGKSSLLRAGLMPRLAAACWGRGRSGGRGGLSSLRAVRCGSWRWQLADLAGVDPVSVYRSLSAAPGEAPMLVEQAVRTATGRGAGAGPGGPADLLPPRRAAAGAGRRPVRGAVHRGPGLRGRSGGAGRVHRGAGRGGDRPGRAAATPPALVVAVVRADFLGRLIAYSPLKAALDAGPFTVGPMSEAELRLAITGPAAEAGLAVEPALADAVVAELREGARMGWAAARCR